MTLATVWIFAAFVLVVIELIRAQGKSGLTTWAVLLVTVALLLSFFRTL